jgi:putative ABC transport system ATP-binding protein
VLKPSYQITEQALKTKLKKLDDDIEFYRNKIDNFRTNLLARFHAGQVKKLEKSKKETIVNDINDDHVINLTKVVKYYNNGVLAIKVLKDIDLKVKFGEFVVILGPSGSGKTTLLNIISGMDNATYGSTIVAKQNLINLNASKLTVFRRNNIGYIFQQYGLLPNLTVKENVEIGANLQKDPKKRLDINELLKTIGIYEHRNKFPNELSGGQQQRVAIARSMAKNPILLFGDEPTGAIDNQMSKHILQLFVDINKKFQTTIVVVTHNPIIANLATKIVYVQDGEIAKISDNIPKTIDQLN